MKKLISKVLTFMMIVSLCAPMSVAFAADQKVVIAGSTSVQPLSDELAAEFMKKNPGIKIEVQGGGSSVGIKAAQDGIADIGASSRELKKEEQTVKEFEIALDGIAVVVNTSNDVADLSMDQIKKVFTGEITNWKEVGGKDKQIVVVSREDGSGTRGAFIEITGIQGKDAAGKTVDNTSKNSLVQPSTGAVKQTVASTPDAIGYVSLGSLDNAVKAVKVEGVPCTEANIKAKKYKIYRPFLYLTKSAPTGAVKQFIDFALSAEGQKIVAKEYITVSEGTKLEGTTPVAPKTITVKVNGKAVAFDVNPINENGRILVPARQLLESLGANLTWDAKTQKVTAVLGKDTVVMTLGSTKATKNGSAIDGLDVPAKSINGRTMIPAGFIAKAFGAKVEWDANTMTVTITK
ncbi:phosphate binding protein [Anaerosolibacter carboniphilus]|uniref:Phosphate-binding protein n=1 Tax=Anaerosolibacter carboniphilus TaxID=1417629 RepID=A0A841KWT4_9FIRM|nr:phosphate ABC transporter substrate-binding protein PstS family protein [Anaerosolibacter carboniphilus]MBB6216708.1 phosphate binding protein [Anaerosolibacter carboniphilus]